MRRLNHGVRGSAHVDGALIDCACLSSAEASTSTRKTLCCAYAGLVEKRPHSNHHRRQRATRRSKVCPCPHCHGAKSPKLCKRQLCAEANPLMRLRGRRGVDEKDVAICIDWLSVSMMMLYLYVRSRTCTTQRTEIVNYSNDLEVLRNTTA